MPAEDIRVIPIAPKPLVLVVDDELTPRSTICRMLRGLGYQVRSCPAGRAALRFLEEHPRAVRLLLVDLNMPRMDGGELAERAKDLDPTIHVVLMAGPGDPQIADLLAGYRDVPFLSKPVVFGELHERLEELLGSRPSMAATAPWMDSARPLGRRRRSGQHQV